MSTKIRPIRTEGNVAYVPLTRGYEAVIDAADVALVEGKNWRAIVRRHTVYAARYSTGGTHETREIIYMHRVIIGTGEGMVTDHTDSNGLNNRRANLRQCSVAENCRNKSINRSSKSKLKGVHWAKQKNRWRAVINAGWKNSKHLGYFRTKEAAYAAYCEASSRLHGEFGRTS